MIHTILLAIQKEGILAMLLENFVSNHIHRCILLQSPKACLILLNLPLFSTTQKHLYRTIHFRLT